ncbi:2057_t:CDS:2, partial [Racocetra fulgida]
MDESKTQSNITIQGLATEKNNNDILESPSQYNEKADMHELYIPESLESQNNKPEILQDTNQDEGFSGVAKDLVKLGGKSITKLVTKSSYHQSQLFKLVAWLTGAKNSVK